MKSLLPVLRTAFTDAAARRASFWTQVGIMVVNDLAWVIFWLIFFNRVQTLRGWDSGRVLLLFAVLTTAAGTVLGFLANCRRIPDVVQDGSLDQALTLPVPTLPYLLVRRIDTVNLGDLVFGIVLFAVSGHPTPARIGLYLGGCLLSVVLLTGFLTAAGSVVFFTGQSEPGHLGFNALLLLSSYPSDVFGGTLKVLLYTAIPAGFVAAVPAQLVDAPSVGGILGLVGAALVFAVLGWAMFTLGLRRYASGSAWTRG